MSALPAWAQDAPPTKLLVVPFQNTGNVRGQDYMQLQFAATVAEGLETISGYSVTSGPLVLTTDIAKLAPARDKNGKIASFDIAGANTLARWLDASVFITGHYSGSEWKWSITAEVYAAQTNGPHLLGSTTINGDLTTKIIVRGGRTKSIVSINAIHNLLSQAVSGAMTKAKLPNTSLVQTVLQQPSTYDSWAFIQLGRAYTKYFAPLDENQQGTALEIAKYAVLVDPRYAQAQRFYATILEEQAREKPKEQQGKILGIARLHYELALALQPQDTRVLLSLGQIELRAKNEDIAKNYLARAVAIHPHDQNLHFWLGKINLQIGNLEAAIAEFENTRNLSPIHLDARRKLVKLYNQQLRYSDSAKELAYIVRIEPNDPNPAFALGAVLRADGKYTEAKKTYADAEQRFNNEPRFAKFRTDIEQENGDLFIFVNAITEGKNTVQGLDTTRKTLQLAANDAAMDFSLNKKDACADGRGISSALLAQTSKQIHFEQLQKLRELTGFIAVAIKHGEDAALTTNEQDDALNLLQTLEISERDDREIQAQMTLVVLPSIQRNGCEIGGKNIAVATIEYLEAHNEDWQVIMPPAKSNLTTPEIPNSPIRMIHFTVDNTESKTEGHLTIDGEEFGAIAPGKNKRLTVRRGTHAFCLEPSAENCNQPGNTRYMFFDEDIKLERKPGKK